MSTPIVETDAKGYSAQIDRTAAIETYLAGSGVKARPELPICLPDMHSTVVMPVYNEAKDIIATLKNYEAIEGLEVVMTDNGSTDGTQDVIRKFAQTSSMPISLLDFSLRRGPGVGRRHSAEQVVANYLHRYPKGDKKHWIVIMDADAHFDPEWIHWHEQLTNFTKNEILGVTYRFPQWVDDEIAQVTGIKGFYYSLARLANCTTAAGIAQIQTGTKGSAVEVGAYARMGGLKEKGFDATGAASEDRAMGDDARRLGIKIGFNVAINIHAARRPLFELMQGMEALSSYGDSDPADSVIRDSETEMLRAAMKRLVPGDWLKAHYKRLQSFVRRNIVVPIQTGQLAREPLEEYLSDHGGVFMPTQDNVDRLADVFIRNDRLLSRIYGG